MTTVTVSVTESRGFRGRIVPIVVTVVFLAWVYGWLWWLLAAASVAAAVHRFRQWEHARAADHAAIAARADQQHAWVLAGDPRGTYGT